MFREPLTTDPKKARRVFIFLVPFTVVGIPLVAWPIILRDWLLTAICVVAVADMVSLVTKYYTVGWPGSRLDSYHGFPLTRFSPAQRLLAGLVLLTATSVALIVFEHARNEVLLAILALLPAVWLFRFLRAMRREGWRGKKDDSPPARP